MEKKLPSIKNLPAFVILGIIALVAALVLALTNAITKGPIAEHAMEALQEAFSAVMPADEYEEMTVPGSYDVRSLYAAKSNGEVVGYCVTAAGKGYNGDVAVTLGVDMNGTVTGAFVGDTSFAETSGFGARAKEPAFREQFAGLDAVGGGSFQALSGATITSTAVLNAVNKALPCVDEVALKKEPAADPLVSFGAPAERPAAEPMELTGTVVETSARGFASDVAVKVALDDNGVVTGVSIDSSGETEGIGQRLMSEPEFAEQFVGQSGPFAIGENIDALSGATVTSTAVVEAVNAALTAPTSASAALTGTAKGFQSDVTVTLTAPDGVIASIHVDSSGETEGLGTRAAGDEAFLSQFIGLSAPLTLGENVDALSGATVTSTAVVAAANEALASAGTAAELPVTSLTANENADVGVRADGVAVIMPAEGYTGELLLALNVEGGTVVSGEFAERSVPVGEASASGSALTGSKQGFQSEVAVTVELNEDGTIAALAVDSSNETPGLGQEAAKEAFTSQFIGKAAPFALGEGIDAVAGATVTSQAVVDILNEIVPVAEVAEEPVEEPAAEEPAEAPAAENALTGSKQGFASEVTVIVALNEDGTIAALTVDSSNETAGLGQEAAKEGFTAQFIGKAAPFTLGEGIDAVAGATVTSQAVVDILNEIVPVAEAAEEPVEEPVDEEPAEAPAAENALTGSKQGFASEVTVTVELNEDGTIAALTVDSSNETAGLGQEAAKEGFTAQFIGKAAPFTLGEGIDAVAGATVTSQAVVDILNEIVPVAEVAEEPVEEPADEEPAEAPAAENALTGSKQGFQSEVMVTVTLNEDGTIAALTADSSNETAGLGQEAAKEGFTAQFIGKAAPFILGEGIDAVAGATVTSQAVVDILNEIVPVAEATEEPVEEPVEEPADEEPVEAPAAENALTGSKQGFASEVTVSVELNEDGTIAALTVDSSNETAGLGQEAAKEGFTAQFIGKAAPFTLGEGIDAVAGATVTSQAVVDILNEIVPVAEAAEEPVEEPVEEPAAEEPAEAPAAENALTGSKQGFQSEVTVTVTLNEDGTIAALTVDSSNETAGLGQEAAKEGFTAQFIGKAAPFALGEGIDAVASATVTSQAVVDILNEIVPVAEAAEEPVEEPVEESAEAPAAENALTGSKQGFQSKVTVTVTLNEDGTIAALTVDASNETAFLGQKVGEPEFAAQFIGKAAPFALGKGIDAVTGATVTSRTVVDILNELLAGH